jgi:hypothetical protein
MLRCLDFGTSPCGVIQIHNFDGDCIFVQKSGCRSFSAGLHVGVQGDLIYILDECIINHVSYTCVHNMRDGTLRRFAAGVPLPKSGVPKESCSDFPVWMFPSWSRGAVCSPWVALLCYRFPISFAVMNWCHILFWTSYPYDAHISRMLYMQNISVACYMLALSSSFIFPALNILLLFLTCYTSNLIWMFSYTVSDAIYLNVV